MVFSFENCSALLWEQIVPVIKNIFFSQNSLFVAITKEFPFYGVTLTYAGSVHF